MEYDTREEAIAAAIQEVEAAGGFTDFDGNNCEYAWSDDNSPDCLGWDGESRRCDCGNRRVYWATHKNDLGKWSAYAEAY